MFSWAHFLTYAVITAITPGPNNLLSMSNAGRHGLSRGLSLNLGIWAGFSVVTLLCAVFCSLLTAALPKIKLPMLILGAAYMLYLAWNTLRGSGTLMRDHSRSGFASGLALQFVNPKIYLYCIVSMEAYILPYYAGNLPALIGFALLLAWIGFCCTLCWAVFGAFFHRLFSKYARVTNVVMALLLVYCAISLFF